MLLTSVWIEYVSLGIALLTILGLILYLFKKLTPNDWSSLRGGLGKKYSFLFKLSIAIVVAVFAIVFLMVILF